LNVRPPSALQVSSAQSLSIAFDGDGIDDFTTTDSAAPPQYTYSASGIYLARVRVTDAQSTVSEAVTGIQAFTLASMDAFFQAQWSGMTTALAAGDKETALTYLTPGAQDKYGPVFDVRLPQMPSIVGSFSSLQRVSPAPDIGEYAMNRTIDGC
jgi:hypothetical protein